MANQDNKCAALIEGHPNYYSKDVGSYDGLAQLMQRQAKSLREVYGLQFETMTLARVMEFWHLNNHALIDEIHEATDALGGISSGSSAIWKTWKKDHEKYQFIKFSDLSVEDQLECKFEIIDIFHFVFNMCISIGMTPKEVFNMFVIKNIENAKRQKTGY